MTKIPFCPPLEVRTLESQRDDAGFKFLNNLIISESIGISTHGRDT